MTNYTPKFTPGPWEMCGNKVCDVNGFTLAKCGWLTQSDDEALANARLIAKAPEMYDLLLELLADILADDVPIQDRPAAYAKISGLLQEIQGDDNAE